MKLPPELTVHVHPARNLEGLFVAEIREGGTGAHILTTQGQSVADAVYMAGDALRLMADECRPPTAEHCHCEHGQMDDGRAALICCHCKTKRPASLAPMGAGRAPVERGA
jgi:hypothetical protein